MINIRNESIFIDCFLQPGSDHHHLHHGHRRQYRSGRDPPRGPGHPGHGPRHGGSPRGGGQHRHVRGLAGGQGQDRRQCPWRRLRGRHRGPPQPRGAGQRSGGAGAGGHGAE